MAAKFASLHLISRFQAELDRLFQEAAQIGESHVPVGEWLPALDIVETPASVMILLEVPGFRAADLTIEVRGTRVTISGVKTTPLPTAQRIKFHCMERGHGRLFREIQVLSAVNTHQGTARLQDGLLTIAFPKIQDKRQAARVLHIEEPEEGTVE